MVVNFEVASSSSFREYMAKNYFVTAGEAAAVADIDDIVM